MKILKIIVCFALLIGFLLSPVIVFSQSNLLPEKSTSNTEENVTSTSTSVESTSSENKELDDKFYWSAIIIAIMLFALVLLFLEIAIIPGVGVTGITGTILLFVALGISYWKLPIPWAVGVTVFSVIAVLGLLYYVFFILPSTKLGKTLVLEEKAVLPEDNFAVSDTRRYIGAEGVAISNLRPSGIAKIADERVDVITEGDFLEKGTKIKVIKATAGRVIVAAIEE